MLMKGTLFVDVVLPFFVLDSLAILQRAINSIYLQELEPATLIIVVNGGDSAMRVKRCSDIGDLAKVGTSIGFCVINTSECGIANALNVGIAASTADWVARLDADDWMEPSRLRKMHQHLAICSDRAEALPDVLGSAIWLHDQQRHARAPRLIQKPISDLAIRRYLYYGNPFVHPSVMIRRSLLNQVGGYRPIKAAEDLDLWLRLLDLPGVTFANLPIPLTNYSMVNGSLSHGRYSFLYSALCRIRHVKSVTKLLLFAPKILVDLSRFLIVVFRRG